MLQFDWLSYSYTAAIRVQWLPDIHEMQSFYSFSKVLEGILDVNRLLNSSLLVVLKTPDGEWSITYTFYAYILNKN